MALPSVLQGNHHINGTLSANALGGVNASIRDSDLAEDANLDPGKMRHRFMASFSQDTPAAITIPLHCVHGTTAEIVAVKAFMVDTPSGGDKTITVDVKAGNESTAYATVLTAAIEFSSSDADREIVAGTLAETDLAQDDSLVAVVALGGSTGSYGSGLHVVVILDEKPV